MARKASIDTKPNEISTAQIRQNVFRHDDTIISTYVDDFMIISKSENHTYQAATQLGNAFRVKYLGDMTKFLGINIERNTDGIHIDQQDKIEALCEDMNMINFRGANTPIADDNLIDCDKEILCSNDDAISYRSAVGTLLHIANMTRPDFQYAVNRLCRYMHSPSNNALISLKHFICYMSRTKNASLFFSNRGTPTLTAPSDSSWGNIKSSKGTYGEFFFISEM